MAVFAKLYNFLFICIFNCIHCCKLADNLNVPTALKSSSCYLNEAKIKIIMLKCWSISLYNNSKVPLDLPNLFSKTIASWSLHYTQKLDSLLYLIQSCLSAHLYCIQCNYLPSRHRCINMYFQSTYQSLSPVIRHHPDPTDLDCCENCHEAQFPFN